MDRIVLKMRVQEPELTILPTREDRRFHNDFTFQPKPQADCIYIGFQEGLRVPKPYKIRKYPLDAKDYGGQAVWKMNVRVRELSADDPEVPESERVVVLQSLATAAKE